MALLTIVGPGCIRTTPDDDPTGTSADKDGMGASVGDTGVFGALEVTVNADSSVLKYSTDDGWTVQFDKYLLTIGRGCGRVRHRGVLA